MRLLCARYNHGHRPIRPHYNHRPSPRRLIRPHNLVLILVVLLFCFLKGSGQTALGTATALQHVACCFSSDLISGPPGSSTDSAGNCCSKHASLLDRSFQLRGDMLSRHFQRSHFLHSTKNGQATAIVDSHGLSTTLSTSKIDQLGGHPQHHRPVYRQRPARRQRAF